MQDVSDEIIDKAAAGDVDAFELIYKGYFQFVSNVALRMARNRQDAEDIVQDVFVTLFGQLKNFRFDSALKTWIYRITVNTSINYSKKHSRHEHQNIDDFELAGKMESAEDEESKDMTATLLNLLNADQRACLVLRSVEGLSYQQIAE